MFLKLLFTVVAVASAFILKPAYCQCCKSDKGYDFLQELDTSKRGLCEDGTVGTPCCSYQPCGWACCGCSGGCRKAGLTEEDVKFDNQRYPESRILLPKQTNDGRSLNNVRLELETKLRNEFNGFTQSEVNGSWKDENGKEYADASWPYEVVVPRDKKQNLVDIAKWLRVSAEQEVIYVREPGGKVTYVV